MTTANELFGTAVYLIATGIQLTTVAAVAALPVALIVFLIDCSIGRKFVARYRCLLWTIVVARLLMPIAPESLLSVNNLWNQAQDVALQQLTSQNSPVDVTAVREPPNQRTSVPAATDAAALGTSDASLASSTAATGIDWATILGIILCLAWPLGVAVILLRAIVASLLFSRKLRRVPKVTDGPMIDLLLRVCDQLGVGRRPRLKLVPDLPAPAIFGLFRPTLCLPFDALNKLTENDLRMIMIHEVMHIHRRDALLSWLLTLVRAVQWFNPIAWLAISRVVMYREQACDAAVSQRTQSAEKHAYTELLLRFSGQRSAGSLSLVGLWFAPHARRLALRMEAFSKAKQRPGKLRRSAALSVVAVVAVVGLTDAATSRPQPTDRQQRTVPVHFKVFPSGDGGTGSTTLLPIVDAQDNPIEEREYDVEQALENLAKSDPDADARQWLLLYTPLPSVTRGRPPTNNHSSPEIGPQKSKLAKSDPASRSSLQDLIAANARLEGNRLWLRASRSGHKSFTGILQGIAQSGPWQVCIQIRFAVVPEKVPFDGIDWNDAVKFSLPATMKTPSWPDDAEQSAIASENGLSLSVETISRQYAPYLAIVIDSETTHRLIEHWQNHPRVNILQAPSVTLFSGNGVTILDEVQRPFVVGVQTVKGTIGVAQSPEIAVLPEGTRVNVRPLVISQDKLDLRCRMIVSEIGDIEITNLPVSAKSDEDTISGSRVQTPNALSRAISARCQISPGQTLLIAAPKVTDDESGKGETLYYAITAKWFPDQNPLK